MKLLTPSLFHIRLKKLFSIINTTLLEAILLIKKLLGQSSFALIWITFNHLPIPGREVMCILCVLEIASMWGVRLERGRREGKERVWS